MNTTHTENFLFVEKYRPQTISDCILPLEIKSTFQEMVKKNEVQNLLLSGSAGVGKTTVARALCNDIGVDCIIINCSEDGNIDTLRTKIRNFASTISISGDKKVVILDEFDYSNSQSTQPALRGFIEEFSDNCRFILTCNYKNRIIVPLQSRCTSINFNIPKEEKPTIAMGFLHRLEFILNEEKVGYDKKVLGELILKYFPDFRRVINEVQRYSVFGSIDIGVLSSLGDVQIKNLVSAMKNKDFSEARKWVIDNLDNSPQEIFRKIYDGLYEHFEPSSIPQAVLVLAEYQYKDAFVADHEINLVSCIVELMMNCEFK
jgi:DNA polymerase III delta prime subunit